MLSTGLSPTHGDYDEDRRGYGKSLANVFPLRSDISPKYIRIDTTSLIHLFFTKRQGNKGYYLTKGNLVKYQDRLWRFFFRLDKKCFYVEDAHKYHFHHMIETDGLDAVSYFLEKILGESGCELRPVHLATKDT